MQLREKLVQLRGLAGEQRGLGRSMTQMEVTRALRAELGYPLSQAYLSQLERGKRVHLSNTSREALARFFQVHPGYLVNDPAEITVAGLTTESLCSAPGFGLAPDLLGARYSAEMHVAAALAPHSSRRSVVSDPIDRWGAFAFQPPHRPQPDMDGRLQTLLYQLRDHPQAERVLVLVEKILRLRPHALAEFEKLECQLAGEDLYG